MTAAYIRAHQTGRLAENVLTAGNILDQYRPCGEASGHPLINRALTREEFRQAGRRAKEAGLTRHDQDRPRLRRGL
jgi:uncharacterized Fe-S radical SAM superfamily protein PflX